MNIVGKQKMISNQEDPGKIISKILLMNFQCPQCDPVWNAGPEKKFNARKMLNKQAFSDNWDHLHQTFKTTYPLKVHIVQIIRSCQKCGQIKSN